MFFSAFKADAQVCSNPSTVIYGLSNSGFLFPLNINTGIADTQLNPAYTGNAPQSANGVAYSPLNGKFYFFKRSPGSLPQEFVSYDPAMNSITMLDTCPTNFSVYVGCITNNGTAYYCWDSQARLFYYNIALNKWTMITSTLVDQTGADVDAVIRAHGSGDAAIDGKGNMLMLPASSSKYALYEMKAPLPTAAVASITVNRKIALTNTPPSGKFGGIALNSTGQILMSTASPDNKLYRLENDYTVTFLATMNRDMGDLTSCNFPLAVLPVSVKDFSVSEKDGLVSLYWQFSESTASEFSIEHSTDGKTWRQLQDINKKAATNEINNYLHKDAAPGNNLYRIKLENGAAGTVYSVVNAIVLKSEAAFVSWPNPLMEKLYISPRYNLRAVTKAELSDLMGNVILRIELRYGINYLDVKSLATGCYILSIQTAGGASYSQKLVKR